MKKNQIKISIDNPCNQDFQDFIQTSKGGFCANCQKEVIDFTKFSKKDILNYFKSSTNRVCGKFRPEQLGTISKPSSVKKGSTSLIAATFALLAMIGNQTAKAAHPSTSPIHVTNENKTNQRTNSSVEADTVTISGRVIDENDNSGLPGAAIVIKGSKLGTHTDLDGNFNLSIRNRGQTITLVVSFIGYEQRELTVSLSAPTIDLGTILIPVEISVLGEICVRRWTPKGIWFRIKHIF